MQFFWQKKDEKKEKKDSSTKENKENDDKLVRIDVEDLLDQGYSCEEVAEDLGIAKEKVYRIKEARKRREERLRKPTEQTTTAEEDPLKALNIEIKKAELQSKLRDQQWSDKLKELEYKQKLNEMQEEDDDEPQFENSFQLDTGEDSAPESMWEKVMVAAAPALIERFMGGAVATPKLNPPPTQVTLTPPSSPVEPGAEQSLGASEPAPAQPGILTDEEVATNVAIIKGMMSKKKLEVVKSRLAAFNDTDLLRMKNKLME